MLPSQLFTAVNFYRNRPGRIPPSHNCSTSVLRSYYPHRLTTFSLAWSHYLLNPMIQYTDQYTLVVTYLLYGYNNQLKPSRWAWESPSPLPAPGTHWYVYLPRNLDSPSSPASTSLPCSAQRDSSSWTRSANASVPSEDSFLDIFFHAELTSRLCTHSVNSSLCSDVPGPPFQAELAGRGRTEDA